MGRKLGVSTAEQPAMAEKRGIQDYEIEDAARTLMQAEEIKKNKELMPHVHKHLKKKMCAIRSVQDLRSLANDADGDED